MREVIRGHHQRSSYDEFELRVPHLMREVIRGHHQRSSYDEFELRVPHLMREVIRGHHQRSSYDEFELRVPHLANDVEAPAEKGEHLLAQPVAVRLDDHLMREAIRGHHQWSSSSLCVSTTTWRAAVTTGRE
jgi:hypothetical protein